MQLLDHRLVEKLKRIVNSDETRFTITKSLEEFCQNFNLGAIKGKSVIFSNTHKQEIRKVLETKGHNVDMPINSKMSRTEKLEYGPNEKAAGGVLKVNRISIKAYSDLPLLINRTIVKLPKKSHLNIDASELTSCQHNCIILVENYENFNRFDETKIHLPAQFCNPLVIYRGDKSESRLDAVLAYMEHVNLPVLAAVDIDPFGLTNVAMVKNLAAVLCPANDALIELFSSGKTRRSDLYELHYLGCHNLLEATSHSHPCRKLWDLIKEYKAGIVQEQFLRLGLPLQLWQ